MCCFMKILTKYPCFFIKLSCTECETYTCSKRQELRSHLEEVHGKEMVKRELEFESMAGKETHLQCVLFNFY